MNNPRRLAVWLSIALSLAGIIGCQNKAKSPDKGPQVKAPPSLMPVYIGTFTDKGSKGIYLVWLKSDTGELTVPEVVAEASSPSYLAVPDNGRFLYCVNEITGWREKKSGAVSAFAISPDYKTLTLLNQVSSQGEGPTHISLDRTERVALVANYNSGSVASYPIATDGKLGEAASVDQHRGRGANPQRQDGPHAHCFNVDPMNRYALSADLGLDKIFVYTLDTNTGQIHPAATPSFSIAPGSGPRHLAFHPSGRFLYVINEIKSTITACSYDNSRGTLTEIQTVSTLPADFQGQNTTAEIAMHPSGKFLYGSNRGHDSIAIFTIDQQSGKLTASGHQSTQGKMPRGFGIDPSGTFLLAANQDTDNVVVFRIDQQTGALNPTGGSAQVPTPVCVTYPMQK